MPHFALWYRAFVAISIAAGAMLGASSPARACDTPLVVTTPTVVTTPVDCVVINGAAIAGDVGIDTTINNPTPNDPAVSITGSTITGRFFNNGVLQTSTGSTSLEIGGVIITGGIENAGSITGDTIGIQMQSVDLAGGLHNTSTGTIAGGAGGAAYGINIDPLTLFADGITNDGTISGGNTAIASASTNFSGGIFNTGSITGGSRGILLTGTFGGGITNTSTGTISGNTGGGITSVGDFSGGINNAGNITSAATAVLLSGTFAGDITNSGTISGNGGIDMSATVVGNMTNSGSILGTNTALFMSSDWNGRLNNSGTIAGTNLAGVWLANYLRGGIDNSGNITGGIYGIRNDGLLDNGILNSGDIIGGTYGISATQGIFTGGITNLVGGLIEGTTFLGITVGQDFSGGIHNAGEIRGATYGVFVNDLFAGGIHNTGVISGAGDTAIVLANTAVFQGGITSTNLISGGSGIEVGGILNGGINNAGQILASANNGILILGLGTLNDGVQNSGTINAAISGMLISGELSGGVQNSGTIDGNTNGIHVQTSLVGGLQNTGSIFGSGGAGLSIDATGTFEDGVTNSGFMTGGLGAILSTGTFSGGILNNAGGSLQGGFWGVVLGGTFDGGITNNGSISGSNAGILSFGTFSGDIVNSGNISGVFGVRTTQAFNGGIVNTGSITSNLNAAISLEAGATGGIVNSGTISGPTAIHVTGALGSDGIFNNGTIQGAIDLSLTTNAVTYLQTGGPGAVTDTGSGTFSLSNTAVTTLDFRGGTLFGDVAGGADLNDIFVVNGFDIFGYVAGTASNLASFAVNGTAYIDDAEINTNAMSVGANGTLFMFDTAVINAQNVTFSPTSTLRAELTTNTAAHPTINVDGTANLAGAFIAHIDPQAFLGSGETEWVYDGIIAGNVTGTFNSVTIFGAPNFFTITPAYNSFDVTISLNSFADLIEPTNPNQVSVGDALDDIYADGTTDPDLLNLINTLANATDDEIAQILDDIAGSMQAETGMAALRSDDPWKQSVGQRVNAARSTGCTVAGDTWCLRRYAQAPSPVVTDATDDAEAFGWLETGLRDIGTTSMWGRVVGVWGRNDGGASSPGSQQQTHGLVGGVDHVVDQTLLLGLAGQYVNTQADFDNSFNQSSIEAVQIGPYFSYGGAEAYVNGNASIIASRSLTDRIFAVGNQIYTASVRFPSTTYTASLEGGSIFEVDGYRLEPNIGVNYALQMTDTYAEGGAGGLGLIVSPQDLNSLRSLVGGRISRVYDVGDRKMVPELRLEWRHEFLDRRHTFEAAFAGAPDVTFLVNCSPSARDVLALGGSVTIPVSGRVTGFIDAEGAASDDTMAGTLSLGARATW
ncbi:MAG: autotransporter domain-containing protein [Alphaproteobacteria bacterium]|nr:autotransporter domain-containing protein [Alphaproteobacteria bacterium]